MHPYLHTIWQSVASVIVPESLAVEKARQNASRRGVFELVAPRVAVLRPGDLIVVRTPGTFYQLFRKAANHKVDHLAIVMENVFRPKLSQTELEQLLRSLKSLIGQQYDTVRVYSFVARLALSSWFGARFPLTAKRLTGMDPLAQDLVYDNSTRLPIASVARAPSGEGSQPSREAEEIAERSRHKNGRVATIGGRYEEVVDETIFTNPLKLSPSSSTTDDPSLPSSFIPTDSPLRNEAVICTDAILPRLLHASAEWRAALGIGNSVNGTPTPLSRGAAALRKKLDYFQLRSWSINDVFSFSALRPDLLTRIRLPPVHMPKEFADLDEPPSSSQSSNPNVMPIFDTKLWNSIDDYLARRHPDLRANSKHVEELLNQVYVTASPLFRSVVQLYSYTMKRLPVQLQTAIRIYIFLMTVRQVIRIWRGYVLVRSGVKVVTRVFKNGREKKIMAKENKNGILHRLRRRSASHTPSDSSTSTSSFSSLFSQIRFYRHPTKLVANMVADGILTDEMRPKNKAINSPKSRWFGRSRTIQSACTGRSSSASSASVSSSQSPPASSSSSYLSRTRSLSPSDHLDRILRHPEAQRLTDFLVDQLLPLPNQQASKILREMLKGIANSTSGGLNNQNDASLEPEDDGTSTLSPIAAPSIENSSASALDTTFPSPSSSVLSSPLSGRKRGALKSLAKTSASIVFPRLTELVTLMRQELERSEVKKSNHDSHPSTSVPSPPSSSSSTPPVSITGRTRSRSETRTSNPSSNDDGTASSASSPSRSAQSQSRSRSSSLSPARSAQFAVAHPHLVSIFEQGKLLLLSALVAQFTDKIRSAL